MKEETDGDPLVTRDLSADSSAGFEETAARIQGSGSGRLEVRCPNCHNPTEVAVDTSLTDLTCGSCGSHFSLVDQSKATRLAPSLTKLGRFELIERLGVGGFGSVWKARDKDLDRTVAIKIPRAGGMTPEEQEKFFREARAAAQLRHPHIVSVHEVGRDGDSLYIVSDYVRGATLGDWLTGQQLTNREAAELCAIIADALHHAHEQGIVHRDLKPANVMMDRDNAPHLMDFGLARREVGEVTVTVDGQVLGTPAYMSPEQAQGEAHTADRRSDVYSLGVILFQLLTGELPFRGNARMLIKQVIDDEPPSPRKLNANVSKDLETITLKCLEKEPSRRYQSADEVASELRRFLKDEPIHARPIGTLERTWRWCRRYPAVAGLSAAVALSLITGTILSTASYLRAEHSRILERQARMEANGDRQRAESAEAEAQLQRKNAETSMQEAQRAAYVANMRLGQDAIDKHELPTARESLSRCPVVLRKWEWRCLNWQLDQSLSTCDDEKAFVRGVLFTRDGRQIISGGESQTIRIWEPAKGNASTVFAKLDTAIQDLALSPDGQWIAVAKRDGPVEVWDFANCKRVAKLSSHKRQTCVVAFSPDARLIATGGDSYDPTVNIWDWRNNKRVAQCIGHEHKVWSVAFSPNGQSIASGSYDHTVRMWSASSGKQISEIGRMADYVNSVAFAPDGTKLAAACNDGSIALWDVDSKRQLFAIAAHLADANAIAFSPDGHLLASASKDRTIRLSNAETGELVNRLPGHVESAYDVAFSPDGSRLASCGRAGEVKFWDPKAPLFRCADALPLAVQGRSVNIAAAVSAATPEYMVDKILIPPDGRKFFSATEFSIDPRNLQQPNAASEFRLSRPSHVGGMRNSSAAALSADGTKIAYATDKSVFLKDGAIGTTLLSFPSPCELFTMAFSPGLEYLYAAGGAEKTGGHDDCLVYKFDLHDGHLIWKKKGHNHWIYSLAVSRDGREVWSCGDERFVLVQNAVSGDIVRKQTGLNQSAMCIEFSPDGRLAAVATVRDSILLWDAHDGRILRTLRGPGLVWDIAFHPSEPRLASVGSDGTLRIWDTEDGSEIMRRDTRQWNREAFAFSKETTSAGKNTDKSDGDSLRKLASYYATPTAVAFTHDGSTLLVGDSLGNVWYWFAGSLPTK